MQAWARGVVVESAVSAPMNSWTLRYEGYDPDQERLRETLCTLGNGRFASRGSAPESRADAAHYPGTYAAGVFNRLDVEIAEHALANESMVNLPDWQYFTFRVDDGPWLDLASAEVSGYVQELDIRRGVLARRFVVEDGSGRRTAVSQRRFVSMADPMLAGLDATVAAQNYGGELTVRSGIVTNVANQGVARYKGLGERHLRLEHTGAEGDRLQVDALTTQSTIEISLAARNRVLVNGERSALPLVEHVDSDLVAHDVRVPVRPGVEVTCEKVVALVTSHDRAISRAAEASSTTVGNAADFQSLMSAHVLAWDHLWQRCDLVVTSDSPHAERTQMVLRLRIFHLLQTVSEHSTELDVGIPARGLHGEAYRGHIFWDETFVYPFLNVRMPEISRALLLYRWRRLPQARSLAAAAGYAGAMFPWQSGASGAEETPTLHLNPSSGHWLPDNSALQRHINAAVAFNTWQYYEATGDLDFLARYGAELLLEIAKFWASIVTYDRIADRYDIRGVVGPDEFHDGYPWRDEPGLDNNAYTNVMAVWSLQRALRCVSVLPSRRRRELFDQIHVGTEDLERWDHITRKMRLCWHDDVLSQFEGYERLVELDWDAYRAEYGDISRLDRILEAEGDSANRYRLSKQADVLMLFYLLPDSELEDIITRLGYPFDPMLLPRCVDYYLARTAHGSTLSKLVHAWAVSRSDAEMAYQFLMDALESDISDVQGGTTEEGIHLGAMAGTVDLLQRGFTGLDTRDDRLRFRPRLPDDIGSVHFQMRYRSHYGIEVTLDHEGLTISGRAGGAEGFPVRIGDTDHELDVGGALVVPAQET